MAMPNLPAGGNSKPADRATFDMKAWGIQAGPGSCALCAFKQWGFHLYYNMPALVKKASISPDGFPWTHPLNQESRYNYDLGALPQTDALFQASVIQAIPSNATPDDVQDIIAAYRRAAAGL